MCKEIMISGKRGITMSAKVTLIAYTPMPEQTVACAAKLCYSPADIETVKDGLDQEKAAASAVLSSAVSSICRHACKNRS